MNFWEYHTFFGKGEFCFRMIAQRSRFQWVHGCFVSCNDNFLFLGHFSYNHVKTELCRAIGDRKGSLAFYTITSDVEISIRQVDSSWNNKLYKKPQRFNSSKLYFANIYPMYPCIKLKIESIFLFVSRREWMFYGTISLIFAPFVALFVIALRIVWGKWA